MGMQQESVLQDNLPALQGQVLSSKGLIGNQSPSPEPLNVKSDLTRQARWAQGTPCPIRILFLPKRLDVLKKPIFQIREIRWSHELHLWPIYQPMHGRRSVELVLGYTIQSDLCRRLGVGDENRSPHDSSLREITPDVTLGISLVNKPLESPYSPHSNPFGKRPSQRTPGALAFVRRLSELKSPSAEAELDLMGEGR